MKTILYIVFYISLTMFYYLFLSVFGWMLGFPYREVIGNTGWFISYLMFMHWWMVVSSLLSFYNKHVSSELEGD